MNRLTLVSPVVLSMAMVAEDLGGSLDPLDEDFWNRWCLPLLHSAGCIVVPPVPGWDRSRGVWGECCYALRHGLPVWLIRCDISGAA
jgi:hypothetical protein